MCVTSFRIKKELNAPLSKQCLGVTYIIYLVLCTSFVFIVIIGGGRVPQSWGGNTGRYVRLHAAPAAFTASSQPAAADCRRCMKPNTPNGSV